MRHLFARLSAAVTLCLAITACGSATAPKSSRLLSQLEDRPKVTTVEIFYWNNKNLGFGHVAAGPTGSGPEGFHYISYAMGNDYSADMQKHGKDPKRIRLPERTPEQMEEFERWYASSSYNEVKSDTYGKDYSMLKHNCAHAVLDVLRALSYDVPMSGKAPIALMPYQISKLAKKIVDNTAEAEAEAKAG